MDWRDEAACAGMDPDMFFPERGDVNTPAQALEATRTCRLCPVQLECLEHALTFPEKHGIWGGVLERERREMRAKLKRGVPLSTLAPVAWRKAERRKVG